MAPMTHGLTKTTNKNVAKNANEEPANATEIAIISDAKKYGVDRGRPLRPRGRAQMHKAVGSDHTELE